MLRPFRKRCSYESKQSHVDKLLIHYKRNMLRQWFILLTNIDVFGVGRFFRAIKDGVFDLSNELEQGYREDRVLGGVLGGLKGLVKFGRHVSQSLLFNSSKMLNEIAENLSALVPGILSTKFPKDATIRNARCWIEEADVEEIILARRQNKRPKDRSLEWR